MAPNTTAWWVCTCGEPINKVGKPRGDVWREHQKVCTVKAANDKPGAVYRSCGMHIEQLSQRK